MSNVEIESKPKLNPKDLSPGGTEPPLLRELVSAVELIDVVSERLDSANNGNEKDLHVSGIVSSLREVRSSVVSRVPVILWENPLLTGEPDLEEDEPHKLEKQPTIEVEEVKKDSLVRISSLSDIIQVSRQVVLKAAEDLRLDVNNLQGPGGFKVSPETAQVLIAHFTKKKIDEQEFSGVNEELLSISEAASRLGVDAGLVVEAIGRLEIALVGREDKGRGMVSVNYLKSIGEFTQKKAAMQRLMSYSQQSEDGDETEELDLGAVEPTRDLAEWPPTALSDFESDIQQDKEEVSDEDTTVHKFAGQHILRPKIAIEEELPEIDLSAFAAKHDLQISQVLDAADGLRITLGGDGERIVLNPWQQRILGRYLQIGEYTQKSKAARELKVHVVPEGLIPKAELFRQIGISEVQFYNSGLNRLINPLKLGNQNYYTEEQVTEIKENWTEIQSARLERRESKKTGVGRRI